MKATKNSKEIKKRHKQTAYLVRNRNYSLISFFIFLLLVFSTSIIAQTITIPDNRFEQRLIDLEIDSDQEINGLVALDDIKGITKLDVSNKKIYDLTGVEHFTSLIDLNCSKNNLARIDISKLIYLKKLNCNANELSYLDVRNNTNLQILACSDNELTHLDLNNNLFINKVFCSNNKLDTLKVSVATLTYLNCNKNNLKHIEIENAVKLKKLLCSHNQLQQLEIRSHLLLEKLSCNNNDLRSLSLKNGTENLTFLNASFNPNLICVEVDDVAYAQSSRWIIDDGIDFSETCSLYIADVNFEKALIELGYDFGTPDNKLLATNISEIETLDLNNKNIKSLEGIEGFESLKVLHCYSNKLTSLDLSKNKNLKE